MEWKSKREAAGILGISTRGVERAVRRGQLQIQYRESKHGKKAWFRMADLDRYKQRQQMRGPLGFTGDKAITIGTVTPMVEGISPSKSEDCEGGARLGVPLSERLMLTLPEATQLSGLPRSFLAQSMGAGKLKSLLIGRRSYVRRSDLIAFVDGL